MDNNLLGTSKFSYFRNVLYKCLNLFIAVKLEENKSYPISTIESYSNTFHHLKALPQAAKFSIKLETSLNRLILS